MSTKQIAVTSIQPTHDGAFEVTGAFWLTTPASMVEPQPAFVSQVPFIDADTLAALRKGTLTEQAFQTGQYNQDVTLDFVRTDLEAQCTDAQNALSASAPALTGLVATVYDGTEWSAA